ncbi:TetR/AcrR family transcriptional regulator [Aquiflexum gelatinilyticum]|uniref:TetR/AcrR family transcriptional regulator n=1 Tax=Aquiflexum gelatinilyticum TaxID=2961943 RepID=A0A9X2P1I6_9BACT|nr:TetR/AcrR family transcriptional regulator [Aquiflexum gelatinilyticum]MCR9013854.1 TetR/AcrR family transcriptional regulator [Aquiflexum gelatinilyticum]
MGRKVTKGKKTKESILDEARKIFNEEGIFLTLSAISKKIGITSGGITNHFPTKEHLFVGLSEQYENELNEMTSRFQFGPELDFSKLTAFFSEVMDIQYKHRSVILFFSVMHQSQSVMMGQLLKTWLHRQTRLENLANTLVSIGLLEKKILEPKEFAVFRFQYVNLFTTWMVSYSLYDSGKSFESMKPIYLEGIFRVFEKYLTEKGMAQMSAVSLT